MPRAAAVDQDMARGRGRKRTRAAAERGGLMTFLLRSPKDLVAGAVALAAIVAILVNTLMLQAGRHPSPMFEVAAAPPRAAPPVEGTSPLPRPRPADARLGEAAKPDDPVGALVRSTSIPADAPRPEAGMATAASQRVVAVQRALTDYGYGQLKPTGTIGADTQTAIQRFERERKLPITGQMSDRLIRELGLATGKPIP